ncbi:hypothetical protein BAUCODRAFT_223511 [Baudoinia panamericana UAMH 10762]|uniref:Uncharacterized protein n=1 Tax=Baudoinia panamericana (strain UAMH 10762) TaxID=717646 RepID=M2MCE0_BAUPA|nr:uncharacterized protein BAUCODRAFT_223511 [Baudoinia panamericana UAMH 10762]EMC94191.1 hypothetical protein BAUCODRAFT_223511 [Baudoinia panamericana UAMH 10762]
MAATTCSCSHSMFDGRGCCPACFERQHQRHYRLSGRREALREPTQGARRSSPSAVAVINEAFLHGEDEDSLHLLPAHLYREPRRRASTRASSSAAIPARTLAFRHQDDQVGPVVGQSVSRGSSPCATPVPSRIAQDSPPFVTPRHSDEHARPEASQLARPQTPDSGNGVGMKTDAYSPMAAPFASLRHRELSVSPRKRMGEAVKQERTSLEMEMRLFDGPA